MSLYISIKTDPALPGRGCGRHIPEKIRREKQGESWGLIIVASLYYHIYCIPTWTRGAVKETGGSRSIAHCKPSRQALLKRRHALAAFVVKAALVCLQHRPDACSHVCAQTQAGFAGLIVFIKLWTQAGPYRQKALLVGLEQGPPNASVTGSRYRRLFSMLCRYKIKQYWIIYWEQFSLSDLVNEFLL